ncbi:hypothetical protein FRC05_007200 [Tulasnella sp. 425]|nr:hypothetical protein FRC05_007200 [Tulasnella sp. 425]
MPLDITQLSSWPDKQLLDEYRRLRRVVRSSGTEPSDTASPEIVSGTFLGMPAIIGILALNVAIKPKRDTIANEMLRRGLTLPVDE